MKRKAELVADLTAIRTSIANQIATNALPNLTTYAELPDVLNAVPCLLVVPTRPVAKFAVCLGEGQLDGAGRPMSPTEFTLKGLLPVARADLISNVQTELDQWCGFERVSGLVSVAMAISMDPTLGGTVEWCETTIIDSYGPIDWGGNLYMGATFLWDVSAR